MYAPSHFAESRIDVLHDFLQRAGLFTLVTLGADGLDASHIPMLLEVNEGPNGRLLGHLARPNGQWKATPDGTPALAIGLGPDAYVSPSWYPTKQETGRVVPTWNYVAVHVHGVVRFFHERERLLDVVERLTQRNEAGRPHPWNVGDAPPDYLDTMLKGIVGVELAITRIEGKWKASQNRSEAERRGVERALREGGNDELAALVRERGS
jgi:transcriptional regulator